MKQLSFIILIFFSEKCLSQFDTTFYVKFTDMLGVGIFQSVRNNTITFEKLNMQGDSVFHEVNYNINGKAITGFILDYDKIYFALGFKTSQSDNDPRKGSSQFSNYIIQLGTNKFVMEGGYRKYTGFFDEHTPNYIKPFTDSTLYYQDPNLVNKDFKIKALYFLNHKKFSYNSAYFGSFRQLKSAASWIFGGNFYYNNIKTDTSLIPYYAQNIFEEYANLNEVRVTGFSLGGGGSANLVVWKRFFINLTITFEGETQWRKYHFNTGTMSSPFYISLSSDVRSSFGFNSRRFYFLASTINDFTFNNNKSIAISGNFLNGTVSIGYRFHFENKATRWLKGNKIYKMI